MYLDTPVAVPDVPGKITFYPKEKTVYVYYQKDRVYDPNKKYNLAKRVSIGKLVNSDDRSLMYPNRNFQDLFPDLIPENKQDAKRSSCMRLGTWTVLKKLTSELSLLPILESIIGPDAAGLLLDLASYSIITEDNAAQHYPAYTYSHPLHTQNMRMYSDSKISQFLREIGEDTPAAFMNGWNVSRDHRQRIWISYDSTNKTSSAGDIALVEPGLSKDGTLKPVINCSVAYDKTNEVPLFYEEYPGSIVDVSQLQLMLEKAKAYGYKHAGFILDRGYFSKANISFMDANGFQFVIMLKGMSYLVDSIVGELKGSFESNRECFIRRYLSYGTTKECPLYSGDTKTRCIHIYHSTIRESRERVLLEQKLERMMNVLTKHEGKEWEMPKEYKHYFEEFRDGKVFLFAKERTDTIEHDLKLCGYFALITSEKMDAKKALMLYKSRDASEKLFAGSKSFLGGSSFRVHTEESVEGKLLVEFIALILRNRMHVLLNEHIEKAGKRANYMSVPAAISELEKIEALRGADGVYRLDHALSATQKEILTALGMNEADIASAIEELGTILNQTKR